MAHFVTSAKMPDQRRIRRPKLRRMKPQLWHVVNSLELRPSFRPAKACEPGLLRAGLLIPGSGTDLAVQEGQSGFD